MALLLFAAGVPGVPGVPGVEGMVQRFELRLQLGTDTASVWTPPGRSREYIKRLQEQS